MTPRNAHEEKEKRRLKRQFSRLSTKKSLCRTRSESALTPTVRGLLEMARARAGETQYTRKVDFGLSRVDLDATLRDVHQTDIFSWFERRCHDVDWQNASTPIRHQQGLAVRCELNLADYSDETQMQVSSG